MKQRALSRTSHLSFVGTEIPGDNAGGHWGSDKRLQDSLFRGPIPDPLHQRTTNREAAFACLLPIAARRSVEQQRTVFLEELVKL